ncbi:MAG: glycosyltransferase family 1 protein [Sphaerospermopsis sp. SIO1G1]|nr:glycosyltransferase family 1 protein [Sphaerospermopsis sp. SIO1G1]
MSLSWCCLFSIHSLYRESFFTTFPTFQTSSKSDREFHPSSHFHITHNRNDEHGFINNKIWKSRYVPHWSMPNIKPRDVTRGYKLENIAYIGTKSQLADEFKSPEWESKIKRLGLNWIPIFDAKLWNDYTNIDLIVAARKFPSPPYPNKGAIKLFNCWQAGVPAMLAPESAFMAERISEYDFIPINSIEQAYSQIQFLKSNSEFYANMLARCNECRKTVENESIRNQWLKVFAEVRNFYNYWQKQSEIEKNTAFLVRRYLLKQARLQGEIRNRTYDIN